MKVSTTAVIRTHCDQLWPLLTGSQMTVSGCFCLGVPQPVACELPDAVGGVGAERRCISDRGTVHQTITAWEPPHRLQFHMVSTDHTWSRCVSALEEDFQLEQIAAGVRITRTTQVTAKGWFKPIKECLIAIGLKRVHYFVFKNWRSQCQPHA